MENQKHFCWNCLYYNAYYTKGLCCFNRLDFGVCNKKGEKLCDKHGCCENWHSKYKRHGTRVKVAMKAVIEAAEDLSALRQIFEEETKEE